MARYLLLLVESDRPPRQGLARFYKALGRRYGVKVIDHRELPADSPDRLADLLQPPAEFAKEQKSALAPSEDTSHP